MKRILITGGSGFVGRQILKHLATQECIIKHVTRNRSEVLPGINEIFLVDDLFSASEEFLLEACQGVDVIIHSAWYAEPGKYLESSKNLECLSGTLKLANAAFRAGVQRFIGIGTCFEYDVSVGYLKVTTPLLPTTLYGCSKASTFMTLSRFFENEKISFAWCRLFYLFGENEDPRRLVPYLHARLSNNQVAELSSGHQIRDFMDVEHAGRNIVKVALSEINGPVNICSGKAITVKELALSIAQSYGREKLLSFGSRINDKNDPACIIGVPSLV